MVNSIDHCLIILTIIIYFQDPVINIRELKEIHSEINLAVPDPILLSDIHDGLEGVSDFILSNFIHFFLKHLMLTLSTWCLV